MDVTGQAAEGAPAEATSPEVPSDFLSIAQAGVDGMAAEDPGQADEAPADEAAAGQEEEHGEEGAQPTDAERMQELVDASAGELMELDPENVPEALRPFLKSFQADYTRKMQAIKATPEAELQAQVAELQAKIAELAAPATPAQPATATDPIADIPDEVWYQGLGPQMTLEQALATDTPEGLEAYIAQAATVQARKQIAQYNSQVIPMIEEYLAAREGTGRQQELASTLQADPVMAPHADTVLAMVAAGIPAEDAVRMVRADVTGPTAVAAAFNLGSSQRAAKAQAADKARGDFSVPSSTTPPAVPAGPEVNADMSFEEIAARGVAASKT